MDIQYNAEFDECDRLWVEAMTDAYRQGREVVIFGSPDEQRMRFDHALQDLKCAIYEAINDTWIFHRIAALFRLINAPRG